MNGRFDDEKEYSKIMKRIIVSDKTRKKFPNLCERLKNDNDELEEIENILLGLGFAERGSVAGEDNYYNLILYDRIKTHMHFGVTVNYLEDSIKCSVRNDVRTLAKIPLLSFYFGVPGQIKFQAPRKTDEELNILEE